MSRGRKRKPGRRHPCGKRFRAEIEQDAMATALAARRRQYGVSGKQARDERLGSALGRLAYRGMISTAQYEAGLAFAELHRRHHAVMGLPSAHPRSVAALLVNEGIFGGATSEATLDVIDRMQRRYREATDALDQCDRDHRMTAGHRPSVLAYRVVCLDEDIRRESEEDLGNLRVALNALVRVFRVPGEKLRN